VEATTFTGRRKLTTICWVVMDLQRGQAAGSSGDRAVYDEADTTCWPEHEQPLDINQAEDDVRA